MVYTEINITLSFIYILYLSIHFGLFIPSACNVDGAAGDGSKQGTCSDAGQKCKADGTCGMYY